MSYTIMLSKGEVDALGWACERGYAPNLFVDYASQLPEEADDASLAQEFAVEIPEHAAWSILDARADDPHALWACPGGRLLEKLIALEESIV